MASQWNLNEVQKRLAQTKRELPIRLAKQAENHFTDAFSKGRLDDKVWSNVNRRIPGTKEFKYKIKGISQQAKRSNPILVGNGILRGRVSNSIKEASWGNIKLVVDLPYAKIHNEGGQAGRNLSVTIPARPYMVQTSNLTQMQTKLITDTLNKIWK